MSADKSERSGTRLNTPSIFAESTSNQVGFSLCSANSNDALIRAYFLDFSRTATTSFTETWKDGIFTTRPFTTIALWLTN